LAKTLNTVTQQGCSGLYGRGLRESSGGSDPWTLPLTVVPVLSPPLGLGWGGKASLMQSNSKLVVLFSVTTMGRRRATRFAVIDTVEADIYSFFKVLHREKRNGIYTYIIKGFVGLERERERKTMGGCGLVVVWREGGRGDGRESCRGVAMGSGL
jgi:hypothetical protein